MAAVSYLGPDGRILPRPDIASDNEWPAYARQYGSATYHWIGAARMGPVTDENFVVDDQLRLHGLQARRVVDEPIMPNMPSADTYSPTMMIAEKASDMIRGREALAPVEGGRHDCLRLVKRRGSSPTGSGR